jgi:hypothetical protein
MVTMVTIDPVGATEIAARCGVDLGTIKKWQKRHRAGCPDFPQPRRLVGNRPAWDWALDIVPWLTATGRPIPDVTIQPWSQESTMTGTTTLANAVNELLGNLEDQDSRYAIVLTPDESGGPMVALINTTDPEWAHAPYVVLVDTDDDLADGELAGQIDYADAIERLRGQTCS